MKKNRVKHFRNKIKLSQRELAAAVGTSQQQIQRIETGAVAARLDLAVNLSKALGEPLNSVFPGSGNVIKKLESEFKSSKYIPTETYAELSDHGVEADPAIWRWKVLLRGHEDELFFEIPPAERRRIFSAIQHETDALTFVVFDTENARVAVNLGEMVYCQFLFDIGVLEKDQDGGDNGRRVEIYFCGSPKPFEFTPEVDTQDPDDEENLGDFANIFWHLDTGPERHDRYRFADVDGEDVFLRAGDIALLQVPLWVVEPHLLDAEDANGNEKDVDPSAATGTTG